MPYQPALQNQYAQPAAGGFVQQPSVLAQQGLGMQQPYMQPVTGFQPQGGPTEVNGIQSAMQIGYRLGPNRMSEAIFDSDGKTFYIVTTDGAGMPSARPFEYKPKQGVTPDEGQYVSRSEFDSVVTQLREAISGIHGHVQAGAAGNAAAGAAASATGNPSAEGAASG